MAKIAVGRLVRRPERPKRLALVHADGRLSNWIARDRTRQEILHQQALELRTTTVVRQE